MICRELNLAALQPLFAAPHGLPSNPGVENNYQLRAATPRPWGARRFTRSLKIRLSLTGHTTRKPRYLPPPAHND